MKLFGGKQTGGRKTGPPDAEPSAPPAPAPAGRARRLRSFVPLLAACFALAALAGGATLLYRPLWGASAAEESAPPTVRPAVTPERVIATPPPTELPEEPPPTTEEPVVRKSECRTFLLLGRERQGTNTDTVIVGRFDPTSGGLDIVSIPRDTLVNVEWGVKKINTVLNFEDDPERFLDRLDGLLGFRPDYYAIVDAWVAAALVDTIGGVYYTVPRDLDYDDPAQDLHIHIATGSQWLGGEDTVKVLRFRVGNDGTGYPDGDMGRIRTQQDLMGCFARQLIKSGTIRNRDRALAIFRENVATNIPPEELTRFVDTFLKLDPGNIRFHVAPGGAVSIRGGYYYQLEPGEWTALVNEALNPWSAPVEVSELDILREFGEDGAVSTSGEVIPMDSFFNYYDYSG